ncbi:MAG: 1-hydroxycarotenoid 3,4-desaturase CrtD, partial [Chitinophagales bacterium]
KMSVAIIGSGIAGIAAAIRLASSGYEVTVFEAAESAGGKIKEFRSDGYRFDAGPSLLTLPVLVDELFTLCGKDSSVYFRYQKLDTICKYFFEDGISIAAFADPQKFSKELFQKTGEPVEHLLTYLSESKALYDLTAPVFLERSLHRLNTYLSTNAWKAFFQLYKLDAFQTLHDRNRKNFQSEKVVQLFDRYATYNGSDPYLAPATLKVIPHLEYNLGAYFPEGGMYNIVRSLVNLAEEMGVSFYYNANVERILVKNKKAIAVSVNKKEIAFDTIISNMDVVNTYRKLLPGEKHPHNILSQERSSSALVFYWGINKQFPQLDLHNIFFSADYKKEFDFLTRKKEVYSDPTVYLNISAKMQASDAPSGGENWFTMINVPHIGDQNWKAMINELRTAILKKLSRLLKEDISSCIVSESILDPQTIEATTSSYQGALYGSSSNNRFAAFLRHKNFSSQIKNLYFCGGSVHPGGGIPLCLLSAKIVSELVQGAKNN